MILHESRWILPLPIDFWFRNSDSVGKFKIFESKPFKLEVSMFRNPKFWLKISTWIFQSLEAFSFGKTSRIELQLTNLKKGFSLKRAPRLSTGFHWVGYSSLIQTVWVKVSLNLKFADLDWSTHFRFQIHFFNSNHRSSKRSPFEAFRSFSKPFAAFQSLLW